MDVPGRPADLSWQSPIVKISNAVSVDKATSSRFSDLVCFPPDEFWWKQAIPPSPKVHRCHEIQKAHTQKASLSWDRESPLTVRSTDLSFHIWSNGNGGPDGWVDAKKHQPDQHASPDSQMTELQKETQTQAGLLCWHRRATRTPPAAEPLCPGQLSSWKQFD